MRPVQFGIRLMFAQDKRSHPLSRKVFEALGGKVEKPEPIVESGTRIRLVEEKMAIIWNPDVCQIQMENVSGREYCIERMLAGLERINEAAPIGELKQRLVLTCWILPAPQYDFASLERKYRETMIASHDLTRDARDSSVILDIGVGDWVLHHQSGAMAPQQLLDAYLHFDLEDVPKSFLFLEASIIDSHVVKYARKETHSFLVKSLDLCTSHSERFHGMWEGLL